MLTKLGFDVQKVCLVHIDTSYVRHGELELDKLFTIADLTDTAKAKLPEVEENIKKFREYLKSEIEPECKVGDQCSDPYECGYWSHCAVDMPQDDSHTVWEISQLRNSSGITTTATSLLSSSTKPEF